MTTIVNSGRSIPNLDGTVYTTTVTLSSGTATLTYTDVGGIDEDPSVAPIVVPVGTNAGQAVGVTARGTTQATLDDGSGSTSNDVLVMVAVPEE